MKAALAFRQPKLVAEVRGQDIHVHGTYLLINEKEGAGGRDGPIAEYRIKLVVPPGYPRAEPKLFETGDRIPKDIDRHVNPGDGSCCFTVWENWLACAKDKSFSAFMDGPVHEYFLAQYVFEDTKEWRFGERAHYEEGMEEAYADALKGDVPIQDVRYGLYLLSQERLKGHWLCPCGSGMKLRDCHRMELLELQARVEPWLAKQMRERLGPAKGKARKRKKRKGR